VNLYHRSSLEVSRCGSTWDVAVCGVYNAKSFERVLGGSHCFWGDMGESRDHAECGESNNGVEALPLFIAFTHCSSIHVLHIANNV